MNKIKINYGDIFKSQKKQRFSARFSYLFVVFFPYAHVIVIANRWIATMDTNIFLFSLQTHRHHSSLLMFSFACEMRKWQLNRMPFIRNGILNFMCMLNYVDFVEYNPIFIRIFEKACHLNRQLDNVTRRPPMRLFSSKRNDQFSKAVDFHSE